VPIDNFEICDSNVDTGYADNMFHMLGANVETFEYCIYLVGKPRRILWSTFFAFSFDFSMAFALLTRAPIFVVIFIVVLSHHHACEPHAMEFDKLLRASTASDLNKLGLEDMMEWRMLCAPRLLGGHIA